MASQQQATVQGVTQVSLLGQFQVRLLDQVLRRLAGHTDGQYTYEMTEDVFSRGLHEPQAPLREDDIIRVRHTKLNNTEEWTLNAFSRPLPVRENPDALIRGVSSTPVLEGDARSLAVALGYSERRFANTRRGHAFTIHDDLTRVQIFFLYATVDAADPFDASHYTVEVTSLTSHKPSVMSLVPMQDLRDQAIARVLEVKRTLKGLVDLSRVE